MVVTPLNPPITKIMSSITYERKKHGVFKKLSLNKIGDDFISSMEDSWNNLQMFQVRRCNKFKQSEKKEREKEKKETKQEVKKRKRV